jgi:hypothetical protein
MTATAILAKFLNITRTVVNSLPVYSHYMISYTYTMEKVQIMYVALCITYIGRFPFNDLTGQTRILFSVSMERSGL